MAILSNEQALLVIKNPVNRRELDEALKHDNRISMHADPVLEVKDYTAAHKNFKAWVRSQIEDGKYKRFESLFTPPIYTNELLDSIYKELEKVFEPRNAFKRFDFASMELEGEFIEHLKGLNDKAFWQNEWWGAFKSAINSVLVVDMPFEQTTKRPQPYPYIVDTSDIIDMVNTKIRVVNASSDDVSYTYKTEYVAYWVNPVTCNVIDDVQYRQYRKDKKGKLTLILEADHNLGYCPAKQVYSEPLGRKESIKKKSPITASLRQLDWVLLYQIAEEYIDLYAPFPIISMYDYKCDYKNEQGAECTSGILEWESQDGKNRGTEECPKCKTSDVMFPGTRFKVPAPSDSSDPDNLNNITFVSADIKNLEYITDKREGKEINIRQKVVGIGSVEDSNQAKNADQIAARFESKKTVLRNIAKNLEIIQKWTYDTYGRLMFMDMYKGSSVFAGDEFFLQTSTQQTKFFEEMKASGLPEAELTMQLEQVTQTLHKDNPNQMARGVFLSFVEPYRGKNIKEIIEISEKLSRSLNPIDVTIKVNFDEYIRRYELEEITLKELMEQDISFETKVNLIKRKLKEYAEEEVLPLPIDTPPVE